MRRVMAVLASVALGVPAWAQAPQMGTVPEVIKWESIGTKVAAAGAAILLLVFGVAVGFVLVRRLFARVVAAAGARTEAEWSARVKAQQAARAAEDEDLRSRGFVYVEEIDRWMSPDQLMTPEQKARAGQVRDPETGEFIDRQVFQRRYVMVRDEDTGKFKAARREDVETVDYYRDRERQGLTS